MTARVVVVGSVNADEAVRLAQLPKPGETVSARSVETALGGKGANQAVAAARAGAEVQMVAAVGATDGSGLVAVLGAEGIDTAPLARVDDASTGRAIVLVDDEGENSIVVVPGANHRIPTHVVEDACGRMRRGDVLLLQQEIPVGTSRVAATAARAAGATVLWNAAPAPTSLDELVTDVDLLLVNEHELDAIAALLSLLDEGDMESRITAVSSRLDANVVCTLGAAGAAYRIGGEAGRDAARSVDVVDTTAAGDTFVGYFAATAGRPTAERIRTALAAGSLAVTRPGAAASIPTRSEVDQTLGLSPDESRHP